MSDRYTIPAGRAEVELVILKSRFISVATYTPTVEAAKAFLAEIRQAHSTASHNVYAFAVGHGASVTHGMSDDGEPSGTAGKPTLAVVRGSGLGDVSVVTTRYFGGTLLGTGGLVKAYTEAAQLVLAEIPRREKIELKRVTFNTPYNLYERVIRLVEQHAGRVAEETFAVDVMLSIVLPLDNFRSLATDLAELSAGGIMLLEDE